ncbi:hypothetical protein MKW94_029215 [Papaver nudicaule]|uniref:Thioredoxin domain-containing protein n=1 Tax=Papaver nudicaule TaxID=74823 RepID=A0AA41RQP4_PAPNU|nr:hypothetical protein [Papaver nudicaule]
MASSYSLKTGVFISGFPRANRNPVCSSSSFTTQSRTRTLDFPVLKTEFKGTQVPDHNIKTFHKAPSNFFVHAQASLCVSRSMKWWDKTLKPNMTEINSAQQLVHSLLDAGDKLVILDFYSPGCGGCKALHPKICQIAEQNRNALIFKVNYEDLKPMCYSLNIHVLPFFRFYRGAEGRLCSFSCTNATIKKFKDALAKHGTERCSLGPAKGLEEKELLKLAEIKEIDFSTSSSRSRVNEKTMVEELVLSKMGFAGSSSSINIFDDNNAALLMA